jgi:hypothetical protein
VNRFTVRPDQWQRWVAQFLPSAEPFFIADAGVATALLDSGEIVYRRAELGEAFPRFGLDFGHAYNVWAVDREALVWLADRDARERIDPVLWATIRDAQGTNSRGQVYDDRWPLPSIAVPPIDRLTSGRWLLAPDTWQALGSDVRKAWLWEWMSRRLADDELKPVDADVAQQYRESVIRYANTFADVSGPNCFSAALGMALGRPSDVFPLWLHQEPFLRALQSLGLRPTGDDRARPGDVAVWANPTGHPVHAAFCVADGLLFNKNGQSWEQPYAVVRFDDVRDFDGVLTDGGTITMYRRESDQAR